MNIMQQIRLSQLSHGGGGCGCKLAPSVLQQLLSGHPTTTRYKQLLVGVETGDDAGVWVECGGGLRHLSKIVVACPSHVNNIAASQRQQRGKPNRQTVNQRSRQAHRRLYQRYRPKGDMGSVNFIL